MKPIVYREKGYQIILVPMKDEKTVYVRSTIHGGNSAETKNTSGIAHLMEHALTDAWKTCPYMNHQKCREYWHDKGTTSNAYTGDNDIVYYIQGFTDLTEDMVDYIVTISAAPFISSKVIKEEKSPVLNELLMYKNKTYSQLHQQRYEMIYCNEGLMHYENWETQIKNLKKLHRKDIVKFFREVYTPQNVSFIVAGNFDVRRVKQRLKGLLAQADYYTRYGEKNTAKPESADTWQNKRLTKPFLNEGNNFRSIVNRKTDKTAIELWYTLDMEKVKDYDVFFPMFKHLLTSGFYSLLLKHLRTNLNLVYSISVKLHEGPYGVLIQFSTSCVPKKEEKVIREIMKKLTSLCRNLDKKMFENAKKVYELHYLNNRQNAAWVGNFYANQYFNKSRRKKVNIYGPEEQLKAIKTVSKSKMSKILCNFFTKANLKIICEGPDKVDFSFN